MSHSTLKLNDDNTELLLICASLAENSITFGVCSILPSRTITNLVVALDASHMLESHIIALPRTVNLI
jgi:hypothetical protein